MSTVVQLAAAGKDPGIALPKGGMAAAAGMVLAMALPLAVAIHLIHRAFPQQPEKAVLFIGLFLGAILLGAPAWYVWRAGRNASPSTAGLVLLAAASVVLLAVYFYWVAWYVFFPADILIWSESDFVGDMIKFAAGYPLYSPQVNNDSFTYVPGPQLLTYLLAWLVGKAGSIPALRVIQVGYTVAAAFLASLCCRQTLRTAGVDPQVSEGRLWNVFRFAALLLFATNSITDRFTHNLHGDALAQLATLAAYYLLLTYIGNSDWRVLAGASVLVATGFLAKQSLLVWGPLYCAFLLVWDRNWKRLVAFGAATALLAAGIIGGCYAIWGDPFFYWTFRVLGAHGVSPLRSFQHVLDTWTYFAAGLLGGAALFRGRRPGALAGAWLVWLVLITMEAYTSGIAWMLNHIGPGCLIAGVWLLAGLTVAWKDLAGATWQGAAAVTASVLLLFSGMGLVRIPMQPISNDAYRYVADVERQFANLPADRILLDAGSWLYARNRVVMGDRAPSIGERGYSQTGDFSGILSRIAHKRYARILVRNYHSPDFWYEHNSWPKPSGIRQALLDNYRETGSIPAALPGISSRDRAEDLYLFSEISILEPKIAE